MKNATATMPNTTDILASRWRARQAQRAMAANIRSAARRVETGPIRLARAARVRPVPMFLTWFGVRIMMPDLCRIMGALGITADDMFRGTARSR